MEEDMDEATKEFLKREQEILGAEAALFGNPLTDVLVELPQRQPEAFDQNVDQSMFNQTKFDTFEPMIAESSFEPIVAPNSFAPAAPVEIESEALKAWAAEFEKEILERDQKQAEKHARIHKEAKDQLDKFYAEYNQKKLKQSSKTVENKIEEGNLWERVYKQVQVKKDKSVKKEKTGSGDKKASKEEKKVNTDISRFKNLLSSLKNDKNAPGLTA